MPATIAHIAPIRLDESLAQRMRRAGIEPCYLVVSEQTINGRTYQVIEDRGPSAVAAA